MNHLKILFDADDTAEDLVGHWIDVLNQRYGTSVSIEDVNDWDITKAFPTLRKEEVFGVLHEDFFWQWIEPMPDSQRVLQQLHNEGHELFMVTATDYRTCKSKFDRILALFPFLDVEHIIIAHDKQMVHGDVLIDDGPHNLVNGGYFRILFDRPHNRGLNEKKYGMYRANSWDDVYQLIHENLIL